MNKHERAVELVRRGQAFAVERAAGGLARIGRDSQQDADALTYALRVLEAVEGVEEWMIRFLRAEAKSASTAEEEAEAKALANAFHQIATTLQAILDAKADDA